MSAAEKTLVIAGIARSIYGRWRFKRLVAGSLLVMGLTIVSSVLAGAMLIGGFYAAYFTLLHYGWEQRFAILFTEILIALTTASFIALTVICLRRLRQTPMTTRASGVVDAFFEGLMTEDKH
jgi:MFS family permease